MRPLVTIIIPFYNDPYVDQAVQSALSQSYAPLEIIVVDDGSTSYADRLAPFRSHIYYLGKGNGGTASALNHGIRYASGEYIAWLSSDDLFYPEKISHQVQFMMQQGAFISHTNFNVIDRFSQITSFRAGCSFSNILDFYRIFMNGNPVNGCTVMMKKELFCHVGLFDENLPYTHDLDFWRRVIQAGFPLPFLDEPLVGYRQHEAMGTIRHKAVIEQEYAVTLGNVRSSLGPLISIMERS
ncbi:glycosyl transferase family 2 [Paenibacillus sp. J23TS9]|uniref:glycosyltransferase family 2 protein n=1 Tax=Paenibacillus sp. J23TS9 TaxID=2807193 RepID=UPI001B2163B5|nr:glycosyltransferase [Paenibacillus sp. J23TS9]GIP29952.1 glycosyl transferase family 2 [Paenibacillus sp. J23TS9]